MVWCTWWQSLEMLYDPACARRAAGISTWCSPIGKGWGFDWLNIYGGGVTCCPWMPLHWSKCLCCLVSDRRWLLSCSFDGPSLLQQCMRYVTTKQKSYSLLSNNVKPADFLLLGSLNMVLYHAFVEYSCGCCWGLNHLQMCEACTKPVFLGCLLWFMSAKAIVLKTELEVVSNSYCCTESEKASACDIDAAVGMKIVEMQKLPCLENKTSHEMERNKMKNLSIPCLKEGERIVLENWA